MDQLVDFNLRTPNRPVVTHAVAELRPFHAISFNRATLSTPDGRVHEVMLLAAAGGEQTSPSAASPAAQKLMAAHGELIALYRQPGTEEKRTGKLKVILEAITADEKVRAELGAVTDGRVAFLNGLSNPKSNPPGTDQLAVMKALYGKDNVEAIEEVKRRYQEIRNVPLAASIKYGLNSSEHQKAQAEALEKQKALAKATLAEWGDKSEMRKVIWNKTKVYHFYFHLKEKQIVSGIVPKAEDFFRPSGAATR